MANKDPKEDNPLKLRLFNRRLNVRTVENKWSDRLILNYLKLGLHV